MLKGEIPEEEERGLIPFWGGRRRLTFGEIERTLISAGRSTGLGRSGKRVFVYIESGGNVEYLIASGGERIYMPPWSMLNLIGLGAEVTFLRDLLDKLGVAARLKGYGEYKSSAETFTRSSISPAHREMLDSLLGSLRTQLETYISEGRGAKSLLW